MSDWQITYRCNENCVSCIVPGDTYGKNVSEELTRTFLRYQNDDVVTIGGGEPTIHENFFEILEHAREENPEALLFLITNGRMFSSREFTRKLAEKELGDFRAGITLYGHEAGLHDSITRTEGSFRETVAGIENLVEAGVPVEVRVVVHALNYRKLPQIQRFVESELPGIEDIVYMNAKYTGKAHRNREKLFVSYTDAASMMEKAIDHGNGDIPVKLFHVPLCTIKPDYWSNVEQGTKDSGNEEIGYAEICESCSIKQECPGIWKTYLNMTGEEEFEPFEELPGAVEK